MDIRFYLPSTGAPAINPDPDAAWEDVSILARLAAVTTKIASAMTTVAFTDSDDTDKDILFRQWVSAALTPGQIITGAQTITFQMRGIQSSAFNAMKLVMGIRVINDDLTVQKIVLAVTRGSQTLEPSELENRWFAATSVAGNYTTVAGDHLVFEVGTGGDPVTADYNHSSSLRIGDASGSDLPVDNTTTDDYNPWVELTFEAAAAFVQQGIV